MTISYAAGMGSEHSQGTTQQPAGALVPYFFNVMDDMTGLPMVIEDGTEPAPATGTILMEGPKSLNATIELGVQASPVPPLTLLPQAGFCLPGNTKGTWGRTVTFTLTPAMNPFTVVSMNQIDHWLVTESATDPGPNPSGWTTSLPTEYTFSQDGAPDTLYVWAYSDQPGLLPDPNGNHLFASASINVDTTLPTFALNLDSRDSDGNVDLDGQHHRGVYLLFLNLRMFFGTFYNFDDLPIVATSGGSGLDQRSATAALFLNCATKPPLGAAYFSWYVSEYGFNWRYLSNPDPNKWPANGNMKFVISGIKTEVGRPVDPVTLSFNYQHLTFIFL